MLIDIEREYNDFVYNSWCRLSRPTKDILKFQQKRNYTYNIISLRSIQFLQVKLKSLEPKKSAKA